MHNAPPVDYPVGRCLWWAPVLLLPGATLAGLALDRIFHVAAGIGATGAPALPVLSAQLVLLFASLIWGVFAWRQWRHQASGRLRWMPDPADPPGWGWFWCEAGASLPCAVRGVIDLRSAWLVRLGGQGWTRWVWLSESSDPVHWLDLRRAVWASRGNPEILDRSVIFPRA